MLRDDLGTRMKNFYEIIPKTRLMRRVPVAIRIDGKSFHTFTKGFQKPFDPVLIETMQQTMKYLCEHIQGCVAGYCESDEITLILLDYQTLETDAWFDYEVQKMCSISASMATMAFNKFFFENAQNWYFSQKTECTDENSAYYETYAKADTKGAMFDARCFNIPKEEVTNLIYWRQLDAARNSVQMVGRAYFSHKELDKKSCNDIQDMLMEKYKVNWNDFPTYCKRGSACIKVEGKWTIDLNMLMLKGENRKYIDDLVYIGE